MVTVPRPRRVGLGREGVVDVEALFFAGEVAPLGVLDLDSDILSGAVPCESMENAVKTSSVAALFEAWLAVVVVGATGFAVVGKAAAGREGEEGGVPSKPSSLSVAGALVSRCWSPVEGEGVAAGAAAPSCSARGDAGAWAEEPFTAMGVLDGVSAPAFVGDTEGFNERPANRSEDILAGSYYGRDSCKVSL